MKHLHVISHDTYASGLTAGTSTMAAVASLALGAFALFDKNPESNTYNVCIDLAAASAPTTLPSKFQIVTKSNNGLKYSPILNRDSFITKYLAAVSAVAKIIFVGNQTSGGTTYALNLPTLQAGDSAAGITIIDTSKPVGTLRREKSYIYEVKSGDDGSDIVTGLIAIINADANRIVNAAVAYPLATDGFKLTGITTGVNFQVAPIGVLRNTDITDQDEGVEVTTGQGTATQIKDLEKFDMIERGLDDGKMTELMSWTSDVNTAKSYNTLTLVGTQPSARPFNGGDNEEMSITLAVQSDLSSSDSTTNATKKAIKTIYSII